MVVFEVCAGERLVFAGRLVENGNTRLDPFLVHQPSEGFGVTIGPVADETFWVDSELLLHAIDHVERSVDLGLVDRSGRLVIHDDRVVEMTR